MRREICIIIIIALVLAPLVSADAFSAWSSSGDSWIATNDTCTLIMWNASGVHSWLSTGNTSTISQYLVIGSGGASAWELNVLYYSGGGSGELLTGTGFGVSGSIPIYIAPDTAVPSSGQTINGVRSNFSTISARGGLGGNHAGGSLNSGGTSGDATHTGGAGSGTSGGGGGSNAGNGGAASGSTGGSGAVGTANSITGTSITYAPGGRGMGLAAFGTLRDGIYGRGGDAFTSSDYEIEGKSGVVIILFNRSVAKFTASNTTGIAPLYVNFTDTSLLPSSTAWDWTFNEVEGNNTEIAFATTQYPNYVFPLGNYRIKLNVTYSLGYNVSPQDTWINVTSEVTPLTMFTKDQFVVIFPRPIQFNDTSLNTPTAWNWSFGDGTYSSVQNASHQYVKRGR